MMNPFAFNFAVNFSQEALAVAWAKVWANNGCAGVDGQTVAAFAIRAETRLERLAQELRTGRYRPMPLRQFVIPKPNGGRRLLGVPTVRDRIVQQALLNALHPVLETEFEICSFAYRPGRSHLMAVRQIGHWRDRGYDWVLDADIVKYFDSIQHARLFAEVEERIQPSDWIPAQKLFGARSHIFALIEGWVSAGILTPQGLIFPQKGIPQGAVVSPILANVYLDDFDEILMASDLKLVRYADDFVVMAKTEAAIIQARELVSDVLNSMDLELHPDKTQITNFDRGFRFLGHAFAGDLIVPVNKVRRPKTKQSTPDPKPSRQNAPTSTQLNDYPDDYRLIYTDTGVEPTQMQKAMVASLKAAQQPIPPPLYVVLGYQVRPWQSISITTQEWEWKPGMSTLYLVRQGSILQKEQGRFVVQGGRSTKGKTEQSKTKQTAKQSDTVAPVEIPIREVERILVFGNIQISTTAMAVCLSEQIPVIFLTQLGDYKGHLWSGEYGDLSLEAAQFGRRNDPAFQLQIARQMVYGKVINSRLTLMRLNRKRQISAVSVRCQRLSQHLSAIQQATDLNQLRGYEGAAARLYFASLGQLITNPGFSLKGRNRQPPKDPVNSLLSFGYTLLFNNVMGMILAEGLNPYLGNLHRSDRKEPHLAFDLTEEFRAPVVDSLMMAMVNQKVLRPTDFTFPDKNGGVYLEETARRVFLKHFEERISSEMYHQRLDKKVSLRRAIQFQVQHYKECLTKSVLYEPFIRAV